MTRRSLIVLALALGVARAAAAQPAAVPALAVYAASDLDMAVPKKSVIAVRELVDLLRPKVRRVAIADAPGIAYAPIDPALYAPITQVAAVVKRSPHPGLGAAFIQFVNGAEGRSILKRYGLLLPGEL
jgi:ABC-type molybdate transport system substrate-binding protein